MGKIGIKVNVISFHLPLIITEKEVVFNAVVFLISGKAAMINSIIMPLDGGMIVGCVCEGTAPSGGDIIHTKCTW